MKNSLVIIVFGLLFLTACNKKENQFDATGIFESTEVLVASEVGGRIVKWEIEEGQKIEKNFLAAVLDTVPFQLQIEQIKASKKALFRKTADVKPQVRVIKDQIEVQNSQLRTLLKEKSRFEKLVNADAATKKQLDDIIAQIDVVSKQIEVSNGQINVAESNVGTQNKSVLSEVEPLDRKQDILLDQIDRCKIENPLAGTVLTVYAHEGEVTGPGKPLYKIADLDNMILKAYVNAEQYAGLKINQDVKVFIDQSDKTFEELVGQVYWISSEAEFTPKTIQTKEERNNLVYAIKIRVKNDGKIKLGMYGEVKF